MNKFVHAIFCSHESWSREWFDVELDTAREVVRRIVDGTIAQYRMDNTTGRLVEKRHA